MANYGLKIAKPGFDVKTCAIKDLMFYSSAACLKIFQIGKNSAVSSSEVTFDAIVAFPILTLVYLYDSVDSKYRLIDCEFDSTKLYLPGGEAAGSYYYFFICYA